VRRRGWTAMDGCWWMDVGGRTSMDGRLWTNIGGGTSMDGRWWMERAKRTNIDRHRQNYDRRGTKLQRMSNGPATKQNRTDKQQLQQQQHYRTIHIHKLYNDGMQKRRNKFFSSTSCFFYVLLSSPSPSITTTMTTHYITARSKTHMNAQPKC
jgi:hypothetical protein